METEEVPGLHVGKVVEQQQQSQLVRRMQSEQH